MSIVHIGEIKIGIQAFIKFDLLKAVLDKDGKQMYDENGHAMAYEETRKEVIPFFPNIMLDSARNQMADFSNWAGLGSKAQVGTSNTIPTSGDTALLGWIAGTASIVDESWGAQASEPWFKWDQRTYRFPSGDIGGENLAEAAIGWGTVSAANIINRALIVDSSGTPTPVTPDTDEILDMTVQVRYYPPLTDVEGTTVIDGITYATILRAVGVNGGAGDGRIGAAFGYIGSNLDWSCYSGTLGDLDESEPNGTQVDCDGSRANLAYQSNSYEIQMQCTCGADGWNQVSPLGIRSLRIPTTSFTYQCQFTATTGGDIGGPIPKDDTYTMIFVWSFSWAAMNWVYRWDMQTAHDSTTPTTGNWNTNSAGTLLRINWTDGDAGSRQFVLQMAVGTTYRILDETDSTKWVEYQITGIYSEGSDWTDYAVTQLDIQNSGPTVGNSCLIKAVVFD